MKNLSKYFLMGTVALSGMTAFTACSSENEPSAEVNPTFNGSTVKAQFALNLPYAATGTRMTENATQQNNNFRGMSGMTLLPFEATTVDGGQTSTSAMLLGTNDNAFDKDGVGQGRYVYRDIEIPVGTNSFVFYGKATGTPESVDADECFKYGYLTETSISPKAKVSLSGVKFALKEINSGLDLKAATETGDKSYNKVLAALYKVTETKVGAIAWNNIGTPSDMKLDHAKKLWEAFSKLKAGSSASVKVALERLAESTGVEALADGADASVDGAGLLALLRKNAKEAAASLNNVDFPNDIHIPDGAVALEYTDSKEWKYQSSVTMKETNKIAYDKITYPASLNYFVKTAAMANNEAATTLSPTGTFWPKQDDWAKYDAENSTTDPWASLSGWSQGVQNSTRTIALKEAIQYGVANLKLTIKANAENLDDNASQKGGQVKDQNINVDGKLKMTGVLVGGQPSEVAWNYEPTTGATFDRTVYDNKMNQSADVVNTGGIAVPVNSTSDPNYTLVLDNKNNATGGSQANVVYVTVELVNGTDVDFYGVDGMVPKGGKFYLVGKLDKNATSGVTNVNNVDHIFVQDHTTVANLTIMNLKNAYNNIPDLRSTSVSVGLAVNLTWENGIEFNVEI